MSVSSVLLIEDNQFDGRMICEMLKSADGEQFTVTWAQQLAAGIQSLKAKAFDVVILDLNLPDSEGLSTFSRLEAEFPHIPIIIWTAEEDVEQALRAVSEGAQDYLAKGDVSGRLLIRVLRYAIERKRAEQNFRRVMDTAPVAIVLADQRGRIVDANAQTLQTFGYERSEIIGKPVEILIPEALRAAHERHRELYAANPHARPMGVGMELLARKKDGTEFPAEISLGPLAGEGGMLVSAAIVDVTTRKKLEEQLRLSQRMEAIGRLAGGVAHDFNNLLGVILGCCEGLSAELPKNHPALRKVEMMRKAGESAADLTRQLLAFGRKQVLQPKIIEPQQIVRDVEQMLRHVIGENINLAVRLDPSAGCVNADPGQIEQVLVNLAANARDAMPNGGQLTIELASAELDESYKDKHPPVIPGPYVMIAVSDTGCGMDSKTLSQVFDPFFTTKELGKGTGLGLAMVYGIVKQSGGYIWVYSEVGRGTAFKVYLPRVERARPAGVHTNFDGLAQRGSETILLAEDSEALRDIAREYLQSLGYTVIEASSGEQALQRASELDGTIHLLLTDVIMPGISGRELADEILRKHPGVKILFTSGYTDDAIVRHGVLESGASFLQKPYRPRALARKIREVLEQSATKTDNALSSSLRSPVNT